MHGYTTSPLLYKDKVITFVGGDGQSIMAFDLATGKIRWGVGDFNNSQSSPILINVDGQDQIVALMSDQVAGIAADGSEVLWTHPHKNQWSTNVPTPLWTEGNLLLISSEGTSGTRALKLTRKGDKTSVKEVWCSKALKINHGNAVRLGDCFVSSTGGFGPAFVMCVSAKDGEVKWKERGFKLAKFLQADGKLILLDEDGVLALARATPEKFEVLCQAPILAGNGRAWTAPTLANGRLYLRDNKDIVALSLQ
jgi:outer membrane protein assembly factor BamB